MQLNDGSTYEGIWHSIDSNVLVLKMARLMSTSTGKAPRSTMPEPRKEIPMGSWISINAKDVRMAPADVGPQGASDDAGGFGTDAAISRGRGGAQGRELQRWTPDIDDSHLMHLEDSVSNAQRGWDQFALNERKFGVRTDYHEELYTTALDPSKSKISVAEAERLAAEIERGNKSNTTNIHLLEERGIEVDDGDMDEEDRYGAVIRNAPAGGDFQRGQPPPPPRPAGAWGRGAPATVTAPIAIDSRREANKVRAQMTGASGPKAASPYGTPKQLASPLVGDAQKLAALNLDPGVPRVDAATRRDFEAFKAQQRSGSAGSSGPSYASLSEMKQFSEAVGSKLQKTQSLDKTPDTTPTAAAAAESSSTAASEEAPKKSTGLNPNAKSFNFNINAKEFTPTFTPKASTGPPPPVLTAPRPVMQQQQQQHPQMYTQPNAGPPPRPSYRMPEGADGGEGPVGGYYGRKRDDAGPRETGGYPDFRKGGDRRHNEMRSTPPYPSDGGHPPPLPPHGGHARSPPTAGMHIAPGMPGIIHHGNPMGPPMMIQGMPGPVYMAGGVPSRGMPMYSMPQQYIAGHPGQQQQMMINQRMQVPHGMQLGFVPGGMPSHGGMPGHGQYHGGPGGGGGGPPQGPHRGGNPSGGGDME